MTIKQRIATIIVFFAFFAVGCATTGVKDSGMSAVKVWPGKIHEDCVELLPGQVMDFSFTSEEPLDFNLHYHVDGEMFYPIKKVAVSSDEGSYTAEEKNYYCVMWANPHPGVVGLRYSCSVRGE